VDNIRKILQKNIDLKNNLLGRGKKFCQPVDSIPPNLESKSGASFPHPSLSLKFPPPPFEIFVKGVDCPVKIGGKPC